MEKILQDTNIPIQFATECETIALTVDSSMCMPIGESIFSAIGSILRLKKRKDKRVGITFRDVDSNLLLGAIVGYQGSDDEEEAKEEVKEEVKETKKGKGKGKSKAKSKEDKKEEKEEESNDSGNWYLQFTLDEEELKGDDIEILPSSSPDFIDAVYKVLITEFRYRISEGVQVSTNMFSIMDAFIKTLLHWLDQNADAKEEVTVKLENYFEATVAIEDEEKVIAILPLGSLKRAIKSDIDLEK